MQNIMDLLHWIRQIHLWIAGNGSMNRGHGRKEDVNLCGIMKNGYNTLLKLLRQILRLLRLSYHSSVDRIVRTYKVKSMQFLPILIMHYPTYTFPPYLAAIHPDGICIQISFPIILVAMQVTLVPFLRLPLL